MSAPWIPRDGQTVIVWNDPDALAAVGSERSAAGKTGVLTVMGRSGLVDCGKNSYRVPLTMVNPVSETDDELPEESAATFSSDVATIDISLFDRRAREAYAERVEEAKKHRSYLVDPRRGSSLVPVQ